MAEKSYLGEDKDQGLEHYGTPRHSGRYPWGSGKNPQRSRTWLSQYNELKKKGLPEKDIAAALGFTGKGAVSQMKSKRAAVMEIEDQQRYQYVMKLREKGMGYTAIARRMGLPDSAESTIRSIIARGERQEQGSIRNVATTLKDQVKKKGLIDVGSNTNIFLGITENRLKDAVAYLKETEGYYVIYPKIKQLTTGFETTGKYLVPPSIPKPEAYKMIKEGKGAAVDGVYFEQNGAKPAITLKKPKSLDRNRIMVRYAEDGGTDKDGTIELRRGVDDLDLGTSKYAQVRVLVGKNKYMKGMAFYNDNMPDGIDVIYNTNKPKGSSDDKVFKETKDVPKDVEDPSRIFGAAIMRQNKYTDANGKEQIGVLNIINEEGGWNTWSKNLASQFLSKQPVSLAKKQLNTDAIIREDTFNDISSLTNPVLKKHLLKEFADECDSAAVHLKAAAMPRQSTKIILPVPSLKDNEIYAPSYKNGEEVALVRYPHGGIFEIPILKVNNANKEGRSVLSTKPIDAVGINPTVAKQLSGADFDGDTVIVIPTKNQKINSSKPLEALKDFDPAVSYPPSERSKPWKKGSSTEQNEMGRISNLITDMTLQNAPEQDIVRAVKHSMVVIDVGKHHYDYKRSYEENGIAALKKRYQPPVDGKKQAGGAATLISKAKSVEYTPLRSPNAPYTIDPKTGQKIFKTRPDSYRFYQEYKKDPKTGEYYYTGKIKERQTHSTKMYETEDAHTLSSGTAMEEVYADYANRLKALGNKARKASIEVKDMEYSPIANKIYAREVASLDQKYLDSKKNTPRERHALMIAGAKLREQKQNNPDLTKGEIGKLSDALLKEARESLGVKKNKLEITEKEWEAIQAGAIRKTKLEQILLKADDEQVKKLAMPQYKNGISPAKLSAAKAMLRNANYTLDDIADALGVSVSTLENNIDIKSLVKE